VCVCVCVYGSTLSTCLRGGHQSDLVVSKHDSRSKGCGFESRLIQYTTWKSGQTHARINSCTHFWFIVEKIRKIQVAKWGTLKTNKKHAYLQLFHTQMLWLSITILPTKVCPTLPVHSTKSSVQLIQCAPIRSV